MRNPPGLGTKEVAAPYSHPAYGRYLRRPQDGTLRLGHGPGTLGAPEVKGRRWLARTEADADVSCVLEALHYRLPPRLREFDESGGARTSEPHSLSSW